MENHYEEMDLVEARQLVDLMSRSITELEQHQIGRDTTRGDAYQRKISVSRLTVVSVANQLGSLMRPPNIAVMGIIGGVSIFIASLLSSIHLHLRFVGSYHGPI
jgi:hypothetical protein